MNTDEMRLHSERWKQPKSEISGWTSPVSMKRDLVSENESVLPQIWETFTALGNKSEHWTNKNGWFIGEKNTND